jgi:hypothetical protein
MGLVIEIRDQSGEATTARICNVTNYISVTLPYADSFLINPVDSDGMAWLKRVFGAQLDLLLERLGGENR